MTFAGHWWTIPQIKVVRYLAVKEKLSAARAAIALKELYNISTTRGALIKLAIRHGFRFQGTSHHPGNNGLTGKQRPWCGTNARGIYRRKDGNWTVSISIEGKTIYLGYYRDWEDAKAVWEETLCVLPNGGMEE